MRPLSKYSFAIWLSCVGVVQFELFVVNVAITVDIYCHQLNHLNSVLKKKRLHLISCKVVAFLPLQERLQLEDLFLEKMSYLLSRSFSIWLLCFTGFAESSCSTRRYRNYFLYILFIQTKRILQKLDEACQFLGVIDNIFLNEWILIKHKNLIFFWPYIKTLFIG